MCIRDRTYKDEVAAWTPEKVSAVTWAPVEKILEMFDIITNPTDDKPSLLTAYLGACMMTSNALQSGRAITILQLLLNPPLDDKGGIYFNTFWEFMLDPKITAYDRVPPKLRLGYDKHPMYTQVYGLSLIHISQIRCNQKGAGPKRGPRGTIDQF